MTRSLADNLIPESALPYFEAGEQPYTEAADQKLKDVLCSPPDITPYLSSCGRKEKIYHRIRILAIEYTQLEALYASLDTQTREDLDGGCPACPIEKINGAMQLAPFETAVRILSGVYPGCPAPPLDFRWFYKLYDILHAVLSPAHYNDAQFRQFFAGVQAQDTNLLKIYNIVNRLLESQEAGETRSEDLRSGTSAAGRYPVAARNGKEQEIKDLAATFSRLSLKACAMSIPQQNNEWALVLFRDQKEHARAPRADSATPIRAQENKGSSNTVEETKTVPTTQKTKASSPDELSKGSETPAANRLSTYNKKWDALGAKDADFPFPSPDLTRRGYLIIKDINCDQDICAQWGVPVRIVVNTKVFFFDGFDLKYNIQPEDDNYPEDKQTITLTAVNEVDAVKRLIRHIKLKEMPRWHPDRLNKRTGTDSGLDVGKGAIPGVVEIRTAIQELLEECEAYLEWVEEESVKALKKAEQRSRRGGGKGKQSRGKGKGKW